MKKAIVLTLIACFLIACLPAYAETYAKVVTPTKDGTVYVRSVAGAGKPILGAAKNGDILEIVKKGNTWHKVRVLSTGLTGYMYGEYIDFSYNYTGSWGNTSSNNNSWSEGAYKPDASVKDTDSTYNCDAVISSSDGYANLRWGPGTEYNIIGRVTNGKSVWALERNGDFYRCRTSDGKIGYIHKNLLKLGNTASAAYGNTGVVRSSDGFAAVRTGAGTSHSLLYTLNVGEKTSVYTTSGQWFRVNSVSSWGEAYIHRSLLRFEWEAVTTGDVNMRSGPSTAYSKAGVLPKGTKVHVLASDGSFARVDTGFSIVYVSERYLNY